MTTIFGEQPNMGNQPQGTAAGTDANSNPLATLLAAIKNEHGAQKFQSPEDLAKGYLASQDFIATLKREKEEAERQAAEATRKAQELSGSLTSQDELKRTVEQLTRQVNDKSTTNDSVLTPEQIAEIVNTQLTAKQQAASAKQNQDAVALALSGKFGEKAEEVYNKAASEMGLTVAEMNALAAKSPKAVLKALGVEQSAHQSKPFVPGQSVVNTAAFTPAQDSFIGRNKEVLNIGATSQQLNQEAARAKQMVAELEKNGMTIDDLTKPSNFFKYFK